MLCGIRGDYCGSKLMQLGFSYVRKWTRYGTSICAAGELLFGSFDAFLITAHCEIVKLEKNTFRELAPASGPGVRLKTLIRTCVPNQLARSYDSFKDCGTNRHINVFF